MTQSDVVLVAHGHLLRVLAACWVGADPSFGAHLLLDPASVSVLSSQHDVPAVQSWNFRSPDLASGEGVDSPAAASAPMVVTIPTAPIRRGDDL